MARISTPRRLAVALLALTLVGAACGGDDDTANDAADDVAEQIDDALGGTLPGGGTLPDDIDEILDDVTIPEELGDITIPDDLGDITLPEELGDITIPDLDELTDMTVPEMDAIGGGTCSVSLTGAHNAEWSAEQNTGSGLVTYWLTEEQRGVWGDSLSIIANCTGEGESNFSLLSSSESDESSIPMAPGTYELTPGGALGGNGVWSVLMTVDGFDAVFGITEPGGTLEVTEFDEDTFSFVLDAPVVDTLASMTGGNEEPSQLHVEYTLDKVDF
jgi:hypothetical protein